MLDDAPDEAFSAHCASMERGSTALLNAILGNRPAKTPKSIKRALAEAPPRVRRLWPSWYRPPGIVFLYGNKLVADVADDFGVGLGELTGEGRRKNLVDARSVVVRILAERGWSSPRIARLIGRRDHSTILNLRDNFPIYAARNVTVAWSYERQRVRHGGAR